MHELEIRVEFPTCSLGSSRCSRDRNGRVWRPAESSLVEDDAAADDVILEVDVVVILGALHRQQQLGYVVGVQG